MALLVICADKFLFNFMRLDSFMPFVLISRIAKNESHVKLILDYVKNIGVSALVVAVGIWEIKRQSLDFSNFFGILLGCILILSGFCLLFINQEFIIHHIDKYDPPRWLRGILHGYIFLIAIMLLMHLITGNS